MCEFRYARRHHECFPYDDGNEHFRCHDKPNADAGGNTFRAVSSGIIPDLGIPTHIAVRVLTRPIPLHDIDREEYACHLVVIARPIIIQVGERVVVLPGEGFGRVETALHIAEVAIRPKHLVARDGRAVIGVVQGDQHTAQRIGQVEAGGVGAGVQTAQ